MRQVVEGLAIGLVFGILLRMALRPMFVRLLPNAQIETLGLVPILFIVAALIAAYLPARRAARVDPNVVLRHL